MSSTGFYRAFEERYRGSRELIGKRLEVYLPFITPLKDLYTPTLAIDLGCGRGEWLELLAREGFMPEGVDLDDGMLAACRERGLPASHGEAIERLRALKDESQCIVSGFHIAEHMAFDDLEHLVVEALRVLRPGGLLILETPNPENVEVGTNSFYLDPTHLRPIPPLLLSFLPAHHGYARCKTLRLQEAPDLVDRHQVGLLDVLAGVSPDYAIVAQKNADANLLKPFDPAFDARYGVGLEQLACRYDTAIKHRMDALNERVSAFESNAQGMSDAFSRIATLQDRLIEAATDAARSAAKVEQFHERCKTLEQQLDDAEREAAEAEERAKQQLDDAEREAAEAEVRAKQQLGNAEREAAEAEERVKQRLEEVERRAVSAEMRARQQLDEAGQRAMLAEGQLQQQEARIQELGSSSHHWWLQAQALQLERDALRASWSWRVTHPLRWGAGLANRRTPVPVDAEKKASKVTAAAIQRPLAEAMRVVLENPKLAYRINQRLLKYPALHQRLVGVAQRERLIPETPAGTAPAVTESISQHPAVSEMTPGARRIHDSLQAAVERRLRETS